MQTKFEKLNLIAEVEKNMKYIDSLDNELGIKKQASDKSNLDLVKETLEAAYALKKLNKIDVYKTYYIEETVYFCNCDILLLLGYKRQYRLR